MSFNKSIQSVIIIDKFGRSLAKTSRHGFIHPNLEQRNNTHFMECILDISIGKEFDDLYGPIRYHHSEGDDFMMFSFPFDKNTIIITSTKNISPISVATKIAHIINSYRMRLINSYLLNK